jgi:thioredoxin 1
MEKMTAQVLALGEKFSAILQQAEEAIAASPAPAAAEAKAAPAAEEPAVKESEEDVHAIFLQRERERIAREEAARAAELAAEEQKKREIAAAMEKLKADQEAKKRAAEEAKEAKKKAAVVSHAQVEKDEAARAAEAAEKERKRKELEEKVAKAKESTASALSSARGDLVPGTVIELVSESQQQSGSGTTLKQLLAKASPDTIVVVDCFALWCGPCMAFAPRFAAMAKEQAGGGPGAIFAKLNVDTAPSESSTYGVRSLPTFIFFHRSKELKRTTGANETTFRAALEECLGKAEEIATEEALKASMMEDDDSSSSAAPSSTAATTASAGAGAAPTANAGAGAVADAADPWEAQEAEELAAALALSSKDDSSHHGPQSKEQDFLESLLVLRTLLIANGNSGSGIPSVPPSDFLAATGLLRSMLTAILNNPREPKYRRIKRSNAKFQSLIGKYGAVGDDLMMKGGFVITTAPASSPTNAAATAGEEAVYDWKGFPSSGEKYDELLLLRKLLQAVEAAEKAPLTAPPATSANAKPAAAAVTSAAEEDEQAALEEALRLSMMDQQ